MQENKMGTMPVGRLLVSLSGPAVLSMLVQALYNVVDSIFVSHSENGERALEALTLVFPIQMLMVAIGVGTGIGINSLVSRSLGARDYDKANSAASNGLVLSFFGWLFFAITGLIFSRMYINAFASNDIVVEYGTSYMTIITTCCLFMMVGMTSEKIVQSTGNTVFPMISIISGAVVNTILDPIMIFGYFGCPKMGITGAAIATIIGQAVNMALIVFMLLKKVKFVKISLRGKPDLKIIKEIYQVGAPAILMQALASVMLTFLNGILAGIDAKGTAVAVMGVYNRLQSFVFMPTFGINQGGMPIMGYNYGARNKNRLMGTYKMALIFAITIMGMGLLIFQLFPGKLLTLFDASEDMLRIGIPALRTVSLCFLPAAFGIITSGLFQATGHGMLSLFASLIRQFVGIVPLAFLLSHLGGVNMVWWSFALAEILGVTYCALMVRFLYNNKIKYLEDTVLASK